MHRGDDIAGSIALIHRTQSNEIRVLTRVLDQNGEYVWRPADTGASVDGWVGRQRRFDSDLWVIELDTPNLARFIDETTL